MAFTWLQRHLDLHLFCHQLLRIASLTFNLANVSSLRAKVCHIFLCFLKNIVCFIWLLNFLTSILPYFSGTTVRCTAVVSRVRYTHSRHYPSSARVHRLVLAYLQEHITKTGVDMRRRTMIQLQVHCANCFYAVIAFHYQ